MWERAVYLDGEQKNTQDLKNCKQDAGANMSISVPRQCNSPNSTHTEHGKSQLVISKIHADRETSLGRLFL